MKQRIITGFFIALTYICTLLRAIYWRREVFDIFILALMIFAGLEMCSCLSKKAGKINVALFLFSIVIEYIVFKLITEFFNVYNGLLTTICVTALMCAMSIIYTMFSDKYDVIAGTATALAIVYPAGLLLFSLALTYLPHGLYCGALIMLILSTSLADTMAYFVGSIFKGPKLCPAISPKKTISGAIGGIIGGAVSGTILFFFSEFGILNTVMIGSSVTASLINWLLIGIGSALFCEGGDLIASYVKRVCGVKDYGKVLAGHGGFMDRIDGLIASAVYIFAYMSIIALVL